MAYQMLEMQMPKQVTETEILQQSTEVHGSVPNQDFFQDNNDIHKKRREKQKGKEKAKHLTRQQK